MTSHDPLAGKSPRVSLNFAAAHLVADRPRPESLLEQSRAARLAALTGADDG